MTEKFDPKELKVLSDILALVLEEHSGQSANALEALKSRAKKNSMTGGALKNLFLAIAPNPPKPKATRPRAPRASAKTNANTANDASSATRSQITKLTESLNKLDIDLRTVKAKNDSLKIELYHTQQAYHELHTALQQAQERHSFRSLLILFIFLCGLIVGIGGTMLFHIMNSAPPHPQNSFYLQQVR